MVLCLGSSSVERSPEEAGVVSSTLTRGTSSAQSILQFPNFRFAKSLRLPYRCASFQKIPRIFWKQYDNLCGYGSMVEFFLAKEGIRVRFPLAAPKKKVPDESRGFSFLDWRDGAGVCLRPDLFAC